MAIINSVLTGKGSGKIGNIVLATIKGQTTAREYNSNPTYSNTTGQVFQRGRLRNAVLAWQFLRIFFRTAKPLANVRESVYNAFIRLIISSMPELVFNSRVLAGAYALENFIFSGNYVSVVAINFDADELIVQFDTNYFKFENGINITLLSYDIVTGSSVVLTDLISESQWNNGLFNFITPVSENTRAAAFITSARGRKISNVINVV